MSSKTKENMANRLAHLMRVTPGLDTLDKIAKKAGVSYGTVRRIRNALDIDVGIGHVEAVATVFRMTLSEFVANFDEQTEMAPEDREVVANLSAMQKEDASSFRVQIARMAMLQKATRAITEKEPVSSVANGN